MVSTTFENRSLAFADLLHDMLGIDHAESHRAYFRVEDVSRGSEAADLQALRTTLAGLGVPFVVSVIPEYRDWLGYYNKSFQKPCGSLRLPTSARKSNSWCRQAAESSSTERPTSLTACSTPARA